MSSSRPIGGMEGRMRVGGSLITRQYGEGILLSIRERNTTINMGKEYYYQYGKGILPSIWERNITINMGKLYYHQYGKGMLPSIWGRNITIIMGKVYYHQYGKGILPSIQERKHHPQTRGDMAGECRGGWGGEDCSSMSLCSVHFTQDTAGCA